MFVSYRWLQDYVDISDISPQDLAEKITRSGIEVDSVELRSKGAANVVVGKVVELHQHPNADKLNVCQVDLGEGELSQIVCGAPNVAAGQKVAVAKPGARLPGGLKIKKAKLRGEQSNGMICSLQELGIEGKLIQKEYSEGIFVFSDQIEIGADALEALSLDDTVLEFDLTPNRADALSMIGVAYEVAAILGRKMKKPEINLSTVNEKAEDYVSVSIEAGEDCPYYAAFIVKDVKIKPSPLWLANRLMAAGIRPINNVVDITNYVLLEYGQPLHAFDYDRLGSKEILVRRAKENEEIVTLDSETRVLNEEMLVITNGTEPVAVAGVMGGASSEVQNNTTNILLEAAYFDGKRVRTASKQLGLRSEASTRFEKGVARNRVHEAGQRAAYLMQKLAEGKVVGGVAQAGEREVALKQIEVTEQRINHVLGTDIKKEEISSIFDRLRFDYKEDNGNFVVTIPTRRPDLSIPEDLIEEVARLYGYDEIPATLPIGESLPGGLSPFQEKRRKVRRFLEGAGLCQATTYSLTTPEKNRLFGQESSLKNIRLSMPMSEERSCLRTAILPSLLEAVQYNLNRKQTNLALYEIGSVYLTKEEKLTRLPEEEEHVAGVFTGMWFENKWQGEMKKVDFFVVKGVLEGLFLQLGIEKKISFVQAKKEGLHPGRTAAIALNGEEIGFVGQVHPTVQNDFEITETYVFEMSLEKLIQEADSETHYEKLPKFPSVSRDIALVVDKQVSAGELKRAIIEAGGELLKEVHIFDVYEGEPLEAGKKSLAFSLLYLDPEHTLTEEEVAEAHTRVLDAVQEKFAAELRQ
ncbi:phenylalanine--tRNA ligase subunit beta [Pueribacillus theae]|uniref:Phenylalanine--tRNA ligase beta subunit n=1 Tax=Pueribacillus theae TaxID=2171751 RepID=A0A2U1K4V7_9BACI|nr:phenylalanine--tRNA ligase subunit beta [Pueribacillus theae]PWA12305.1 phenylalanine--tRNA ligase subunit beta [Pueribacillus theae]